MHTLDPSQPATPSPGSEWAEIKQWRRGLRRRLIDRRRALDRESRLALRDSVASRILEAFPELADHTIGFYWPIQGELDLRPLIEDLVGRGASACLPVVVEKNRPVEFWAWRPGMRMSKGFWDIPQPPERELSRPTALLVPLVGFDPACFRLGYGGGYYDRTLASLEPRPLRIGVGLELGRLETICPQAHDIPMNAVVTESAVIRR